ncbi:MAG: hypothetical protein AAGN46_12560 [Acidobacteriota bacterium]
MTGTTVTDPPTIEFLGIEDGVIRYIFADGCVFTCPQLDFTEVLVLGPLAVGDYTLRIEKPNGSVAAQADFAVAEGTGLPGWSIGVTGSSVTDNDDLTLVLGRLGLCEIADPRPTRIEGSTIVVPYESIALPGCPPGEPTSLVLTARVGLLEAGLYTVEVERLDGGVPVEQVEIGGLNVADAPDEVRLLDDRFQVTVTWRDFDGNMDVGRPAPFRTDQSGLFTFFDRGNWEVTVKVLDGCGVNDRYWVFLSAATNVEYTVTVTDTETGMVEVYQNPLGVDSPAFTDTDAFATCDAG